MAAPATMIAMEHFDTRQVRRTFARAAAGYDNVTALQRQVQAQLLESLEYWSGKTPAVALDVGCGTGHAAAAMSKRWPKAHVLALDFALPMLHQAKKVSRWWRPFARVCADARALPLAQASVDVLFCNLCLQWISDLPAVFAGFRRVLRPGGLLLCSTFGPDTLIELRQAFTQTDHAPHVSPFADIATFGDALLAAGFRDPVLDRDSFTLTHTDLPALMRTLRAMGATNAVSTRRRTLTGRSRFAAAAQAYKALYTADGHLPSTWEVVYAHAWAPEPGAPIRQAGGEIATIPVQTIPIRRRSPP